MPISSVTNRVSYQCDGTSAVFAFPYRFHAHADLQGFIYNSSLSEPNLIRALELNASGGFGFTVSATADQSNVYPNGGSVVLNSAPNAQCVIVVFRSSAITNGFSISKNGPIPSSGINNAFDYLTMLIQRGQDLLTRSVRLPDGYPRAFNPTLPNTIVASSVLMFNSGATGFAIGPTAYEIANAQSSALSAANSEASASASAVAANSAAVSAGNSAFNANSAAVSIQNAVSLIGSTAYWGAEAASSALSAFNSQVLANSGALSASNSAAASAVSAASASSSALSASNSAASASSSALSASNNAALLAGVFGTSTIFVSSTAGSATYTTRPGQKWMRVFVTGGGGGGGGGAATSGNGNAGASGAGGGTAIKTIAVTQSSYPYVIGAGGAGGTNTGGNGVAGSSSIFGSTVLATALVGQFGSGGTGAAAPGFTGPGYSNGITGPGGASGGDVNFAGGFGTPGTVLGAGQVWSGKGGFSYWGDGGSGGQGTAAGSQSSQPGAGGGGGAVASGGSSAGAAGRVGMIYIEEYYGF